MIIYDDASAVDLTHNRIPELLAHYGHTPTQIVEDSGDPTDLPARIRRALIASNKRTPARYADAIPTRPELRTWVDNVISRTAIAPAVNAPRINQGPSLLLLGPTGAGKTYEALGALRLLAASGVYGTIRAISTPDLYADIRPSTGNPELFDQYAQTSVLCLDDLGAGKPSEWTEEITYRLINYRYERMMPTVFTSNVLPTQLRDVLGERVASRMAEMCTQVVIDVPDRRRGGQK